MMTIYVYLVKKTIGQELYIHFHSSPSIQLNLLTSGNCINFSLSLHIYLIFLFFGNKVDRFNNLPSTTSFIICDHYDMHAWMSWIEKCSLFVDNILHRFPLIKIKRCKIFVCLLHLLIPNDIHSFIKKIYIFFVGSLICTYMTSFLTSPFSAVLLLSLLIFAALKIQV